MGLLSKLAVKAAKSAAKKAPKAVEKPRSPLAVKPPLALPAPPKPLALPAPGPGLPPLAVKPKGGQWWADKGIGAMRQSDLGVRVAKLPDTDTWVVRGNGPGMKLFGSEDEARAYVDRAVSEANPNRSPENAVRRIADQALRLAPDAEGPLSQLQAWFNKAAPKYIKNDLGTPDDPMRALAESGSLHVGLSPEEWSEAAKQVLRQETIGDVLGLNQLYTPEGALPGAGYDYGANVAINMPWLKKAPVTDKLYGIADTRTLQDTMGMSHLLDEMKNALDPRSGLPPELMLRPESLERMSLPAAAERVSLINQYRAKEMERAALSALDSPAVWPYKNYPENNPRGLRWVELKAPENVENLLDDADRERLDLAVREGRPIDPQDRETILRVRAQRALEDALRYEGDTMGHCVGGYCPDVMSGRSRIFSLRDAKGEPHVTIETRPGGRRAALAEIPRDVLDELTADALADTNAVTGPMGIDMNDPRWTRTYQTNLGLKQREWIDNNPLPDEIVQIKGKQNLAPKQDYLPFVQDFVKSQKWANIGDIENTGLVRLPDGRYITAQQAEEGIAAIPDTTVMQRAYASREMVPMRRVYDPTVLDQMDIDEWKTIAPYFEGFAIGGRVDADRCFCRHPMAVKR